MMQMQKRLAELEKKQKQTAETSATVVEELAALQNEGLFQAVDTNLMTGLYLIPNLNLNMVEMK